MSNDPRPVSAPAAFRGQKTFLIFDNVRGVFVRLFRNYCSRFVYILPSLCLVSAWFLSGFYLVTQQHDAAFHNQSAVVGAVAVVVAGQAVAAADE